MDVAVEEEAYMDMGDDFGTDEITQEDAWVVIDKYFKEKGLVGQQIDSFDEFVINTIQELIEDAGEITVTPENQYLPGQDSEMVSFPPFMYGVRLCFTKTNFSSPFLDALFSTLPYATSTHTR